MRSASDHGHCTPVGRYRHDPYGPSPVTVTCSPVRGDRQSSATARPVNASYSPLMGAAVCDTDIRSELVYTPTQALTDSTCSPATHNGSARSWEIDTPLQHTNNSPMCTPGRGLTSGSGVGLWRSSRTPNHSLVPMERPTIHLGVARPLPRRATPIESGDDVHRTAQRLKQIEIGKHIPGYILYAKTVPREQRDPNCFEHPHTPRTEGYSKRAFDNAVREWKRALHRWDPAADSSV